MTARSRLMALMGPGREQGRGLVLVLNHQSIKAVLHAFPVLIFFNFSVGTSPSLDFLILVP